VRTIQDEFSQNAQNYTRYNIIQSKVIDQLMALVEDSPASVLDIGCGSGGVYEAIAWEMDRFVGVDFAEGMLALHPEGEEIQLEVLDFNDPLGFERFAGEQFDRIFSASALQWASDLDRTLAQIATLEAPVSLAIFTSGTFETLHQTAGIPPLLRSREVVLRLASRYFEAEMTTLRYTLAFSSVREMFRYIKRSGVGGARGILSVGQMKELMRRYPLSYLEYEIVLIHEPQRRADDFS